MYCAEKVLEVGDAKGDNQYCCLRPIYSWLELAAASRLVGHLVTPPNSRHSNTSSLKQPPTLSKSPFALRHWRIDSRVHIYPIPVISATSRSPATSMGTSAIQDQRDSKLTASPIQGID
jgi:hypothetical protein